MTSVTQWLNTIAVYEREFKVWEGRVEKIVNQYRDHKRQKNTTNARFNILWSNVQTAMPAVFSRLPQPDVSRRFHDNDPIGRVAALILERSLDFEVEHYPDYRSTMKKCVLDRFLGGRGTSWIRYEPAQGEPIEPKEEAPTAQGSDDEDEKQAPEKPGYECAPSDYVFWKDFGHNIARNWEEVTAVWRKVYMGRQALVKRFGKIGEKIPLDTRPEKKESGGEVKYEACIYEIWDLTTKTALWLSRGMKELVDEKPDPLGLDGFWPCPKPLYATLSNESLVPVPDYVLYQDQAETLNTLASRIEGLVQMLQVKGVYNAAEPTLKRVFTEGENGSLLPVENWAAFAEKQGLKGAIDVMDLAPIYEALTAAYEAAEQQKNIIYEITGLADILRGSTDPDETATAQKLKGNFGSMRLRAMQGEVAQFATEILQIKAQIICKYDPNTLMQIGAVQNLSDDDKQYIPQALQLLANATLRDFRIEIVADSMIYMDEQQEKADRMELAQAIGNFLKEAIPAAQQNPQLAPLLMEMLKFIVTGFRVGKTMEGLIDTTMDQLKQAAANPQQKPDPEMVKVQAQGQLDQQKAQFDAQAQQQKMQGEQQLAQFKAELDAKVAQAQQTAQAQQAAQENQLESQREQQKMQLQAQLEQHKASLEAQQQAAQLAFERWKVEQDNAAKVAIAEIAAKATLASAQLSAARAEAQGGGIVDKKPEVANAPVSNPV